MDVKSAKRRDSVYRAHTHDPHLSQDIDSSIPVPDGQNDTESDRSSGIDEETGDDRHYYREKSKYFVTWGVNDPENPRHWSARRKWTEAILISLITFIQPCTSTIAAPEQDSIAEEFGVTSQVTKTIIISVFILGFSCGGFLWCPLSEVYGRWPLYQVTNFGYFIFNLACGFTRSANQLIVCRFIAGFFGSCPASMGGGSIADLFDDEQRATAVGIFSLGPTMGPSLGPIAGGFIASYSTWRWSFWATSILDAVLAGFMLLMMRETFEPVLLRKKSAALRAKFNDNRYHCKYERCESLGRTMVDNLVRPIKLLTTQPIIQFLSVYIAFIYGILFILLTSYAGLWKTRYHQTSARAGLNYISLTIGYIAAAQLGTRVSNLMYKRLKRNNNNHAEPEFRLPIVFLSAVLLPCGLIMYGWSAQYKVHWIVPNIAMAINAYSILSSFQPLQLYIVDSYRHYSASAMAAVCFLRSICGFAFPIFVPNLYANPKLEYGWGNTILALIGLAIGPLATWVLWRSGKRLRRVSKYLY